MLAIKYNTNKQRKKVTHSFTDLRISEILAHAQTTQTWWQILSTAWNNCFCTEQNRIIYNVTKTFKKETTSYFVKKKKRTDFLVHITCLWINVQSAKVTNSPPETCTPNLLLKQEVVKEMLNISLTSLLMSKHHSYL